MPNQFPKWEDWTASEWAAIDNAIAVASPKAVTDAFVRLTPNFSNAEWLTPTHRVGRNASGVRERAPHPKALADAISEYTAASVPLHLADAWTYFSRAMSAVSAGAIEVAQHLLYYSELRATQALLFRHGVLLFNQSNLALTPGGSREIALPNSRIARNTHQATWVLFKQWAKSTVATEFVGNTVSMRGISLNDWIAERPKPSSLSSILGPLLEEQWGMDIRQFSGDRELRNQLSYQPTRLLQTPTGVTPALISDLFSQVWTLLEPESVNTFETLDRYISRHAFEAMAIQQGSGRVGALSAPQYASMNQDWVDRVLGTGSGDSVLQFLKYPASASEPTIVDQAGKTLTGGTLAQKLTGMLGRSLILLRLATGATSDLLREAGTSASDVDFWLVDMLTVHGIRVPSGAPRDYTELYDGIGDLVADIGPLASELSTSELAQITERYSLEFQTLSGFERVPAWSIA